jgi:predicted ATPase
MTVPLLERDAELDRLRETLRQAGRGRGAVVLVSGEAGIGKTSLVRAFAEHARARARVLVGVCDDLVTPRTLGPFRDMARDDDGPWPRPPRRWRNGTRSSAPSTRSSPPGRR